MVSFVTGIKRALRERRIRRCLPFFDATPLRGLLVIADRVRFTMALPFFTRGG